MWFSLWSALEYETAAFSGDRRGFRDEHDGAGVGRFRGAFFLVWMTSCPFSLDIFPAGNRAGLNGEPGQVSPIT